MSTPVLPDRRLSSAVKARIAPTESIEHDMRRWVMTMPESFRQGWWLAVLVLDGHMRIEDAMRVQAPVEPPETVRLCGECQQPIMNGGRRRYHEVCQTRREKRLAAERSAERAREVAGR